MPNSRRDPLSRLAPALALVLGAAVGQARAGDGTIAVLDFELNDLTLDRSVAPINRTEVSRTAGLQSALAGALESRGYRLVDIGREAQRQVNAGFGYLWDHDDVAAELGRHHGADWIVVGRNHKASELFVYLQADVIDSHSQRRVGDLYVEVKGQQEKIMPEGVARLADQIDTAVRGQEPPDAR